jgi:hypothetical protein
LQPLVGQEYRLLMLTFLLSLVVLLVVVITLEVVVVLVAIEQAQLHLTQPNLTQ